MRSHLYHHIWIPLNQLCASPVGWKYNSIRLITICVICLWKQGVQHKYNQIVMKYLFRTKLFELHYRTDKSINIRLFVDIQLVLMRVLEMMMIINVPQTIFSLKCLCVIVWNENFHVIHTENRVTQSKPIGHFTFYSNCSKQTILLNVFHWRFNS